MLATRLSFCLAAVVMLALGTMVPSASAGSLAMTMDFNDGDNIAPTGWTLTRTRGGGIFNNRMEGFATDKGMQIEYELPGHIASNVTEVAFTFYGQIRDSFWSSSHTTNVMYYDDGDSNPKGWYTSHWNETYDHGNKNQMDIRMFGEGEHGPHEQEYPEIFPTFYNEVTYRNGSIRYVLTDTSTGNIKVDYTRVDAAIDLSLITHLRLHLYHTTGGGTTWIDDATVAVEYADPVPGPLAAVGVLPLMLWFSRRRKHV